MPPHPTRLPHARSQGKIDEADAKIFCAQLLLAVEHVHAHGIIHRDIKLENILVADDGARRPSGCVCRSLLVRMPPLPPFWPVAHTQARSS